MVELFPPSHAVELHLPSHLEKLIAGGSYHPRCAVLMRTIAIFPNPIAPYNVQVFAHSNSKNATITGALRAARSCDDVMSARSARSGAERSALCTPRSGGDPRLALGALRRLCSACSSALRPTWWCCNYLQDHTPLCSSNLDPLWSAWPRGQSAPLAALALEAALNIEPAHAQLRRRAGAQPARPARRPSPQVWRPRLP